MPVSNPSYFPDQRGNGSIIGITAGQLSTGANAFLAGTNAGRASTVDDLIVIGNGAGAAGITGADLAGSIIIGVGSAPFLQVGAGNAAPLILVGPNNLEQFAQISPTDGCDSTIVIGSGILNGASAQNISESVFIGTDLFPQGSIFPAIFGSVVLGSNIDTAASSAITSICRNSVLIGSDLFSNTGACGQYDNGVYIGANLQFTQDGTGVSNISNVIVGVGVTVPLAGGNISLGQGGYANTGGNADAESNVCIGSQAFYSGKQNIVLGANAVNPQIAADGNFGCVIIGPSAGQTIIGSGLTNVLLIEAATTASGAGAVASSLLYGSFLTGNLILGNSTIAGANRDLEGTNTVKLLNGIVGGANPVGGGYFYVVAGALHWVGSAGSDTVVAPA